MSLEYNTFKTFGSHVTATSEFNKHKLQLRSIKCTFIGYSLNHKEYRCLDPTGKVIISRNVIFDKLTFSFSKMTTANDLTNLKHETYSLAETAIPIVPFNTANFSSHAQIDSILPTQSPSTLPVILLWLILNQVHHRVFFLTLMVCKHRQSQESINLKSTWLPKSQLQFMKLYNMNTENLQCGMNF